MIVRAIALFLVIAFQVAVVLCWRHCAPWLPRPADGYVWEHSLDEWAVISARHRAEAQRKLVWAPVGHFDPATNHRWESWQWIWEPYPVQ